MDFLSLDKEAKKEVKQINQSSIRLIQILEVMDEHQGYRFLDYPNLWSYVTIGLGLSNSDAYRYTSVMKKARLLPALKVEVESGNISVPKAAQIVKVIKEDNQALWIERAK